MHRTIALLFATSILAVLPVFAAETYIIPVWGDGVRGAAGTYSSVISFTNTSDDIVSVKVVDVVPVQYSSETCPVVACADSRWVVQPHSTLTHGDVGETGVFFNQRRLILGTIVLESSAPLHIESDIYLSAARPVEAWQSVQIAPTWLVGDSVIPRAIPDHAGESGFFKLYLINPNDFAIRIDYFARPDGRGTAMIAARAIEVVTLPFSFVCPSGCGSGERPTGSGTSVELTSNFSYLAAAVSPSMALPPVVRCALPE